MTTDDHPAVKGLHETLKSLPDACDEQCAEEVRSTRKRLRKERRKLRKEVQEMAAEDGMEIEDPESVDLLEDEHPRFGQAETPELA